MAKKTYNKKLHAAKNSKKDEFYTQLSDIEKELKHYKQHFKDKVVYCNCDDPRVSNFFHYFSYNFEVLGLRKLITTCYKSQDMEIYSKNDSDRAICLEYEGAKRGNSVPSPEEIGIKHLNGDGDFRSKEAIELLQQADIVVTNPPFSLFREYVEQLVTYNKKFIIIGNHNAITYKDIFKLLQSNAMWLGYMHPSKFIVPDHYEQRECRSWRDDNGVNWRSLGNACWFTNLEIDKRNEHMILYKKYADHKYLKYDNYNAIEVGKTADIPLDYDGVMGVPVTFMDKYNPKQFNIIGLIAGNIRGMAGIPSSSGKDGPYINGKLKYGRILIKHCND